MTSRLGLAGAALMVTALSVFVTWPLAAVMSSQIAAHHDAFFSIWRLGWIAHVLTTSPGHLFDANIFYPSQTTLAYSDATLLEGLIAAPLFWAGMSPSLIYNVLLLGGFAGSGFGMFVLARHLTHSTGPALVAAAAYTMLPYRIEHFMHLELQWSMFVPLTFWALHRAVESERWQWGAAAGVFLWLQLISCVYYGVFLAITLVAFVPLLALTVDDGRRRSTLVPLAAAALVAIALSLPLALPYRSAANDLGGRTIDDIMQYSATPANYFATAASSRLWGWTADRWGASELRMFPGAVALVLAAMSLLRRPWRPVILYGVTTLLVIDLSFGLHSSLYRTLLDHLAPLRGFRSVSRFAAIGLCALSLLAAFGTDALRRRLRQPRARAALVPVLLGLMLLDSSNGPMDLEPGVAAEPPDAYRMIRSAAPGTLLELPMPDLDRLPGREPYYQAWSIWHWKPLVNGYSGYYPRDYLTTVLRMDVFPEEGTIDRLRAHGVRYVVVHRAFYEPAAYTRLVLQMAAHAEFKPLGRFKDPVGTADIFELRNID